MFKQSLCTVNSVQGSLYFFVKLSPFFEIYLQKVNFPEGFLISQTDFFKKGDKFQKIMYHLRVRSGTAQ